MMNSQKPNYANAAKTEMIPTKDQAIIIDALEGSQLREYLLALAEKIPPAQIRFASKISNNRMCFYLANKSVADELVDVHKTVEIQNTALRIRPLIARNKRVVFSNIPPNIPNTDLENKLKSLSIEIASSITYLRTGVTDTQFTHVMGFRRQVYIHPDDIAKLPESFQLTCDDTKYWIYATPDLPGCYLCKKEGHIAKNCPSQANETDSGTQERENPLEITAKNKRQLSDSDSSIHKQIEVDPDQEKHKQSTSAVQDENITVVDDNKFPALPSQGGNNKKKRFKVAPKEKQYTESLAIIKEAIESEPKAFPLNALQFQNLLEKSHGKENIQGIADEFETGNGEICEMIKKLYPIIPERGLKNRFTRIMNKLKSTDEQGGEHPLDFTDSNEQNNGNTSEEDSMELQ